MSNQMEERLAEEILTTVKRLSLPLKLDRLTEAKGNCFPLAILDQCHRQEILHNLPSSVKTVIEMNNPTLLRKQVYSFIANSKHSRIHDWISSYENVVMPLENITWTEYWEKVTCNYEWVDSIFIQATAWYLEHDIKIVSTSSTKSKPFILVSGKLLSESLPSNKSDIVLGSNSNVHYQSLLPTDTSLVTNEKMKCFTYSVNGREFNFAFKESKIVKCAFCLKEFKNILRHIQQSKCAVLNIHDFSTKFKAFTSTVFELERKQNQNDRKQKSRAKK